MTTLYEYMTDVTNVSELLYESNECMYPDNIQDIYKTKLSIWIGTHGKDRMRSRRVNEKEVKDAIFGAYKQIKEKYGKREISVCRNGVDSCFTICDARKNRSNPLSVVCFISRMNGLKDTDAPDRWRRPSITVKTVFKGDDFAGMLSSPNRKGRVQLWLYND